MRGDNFITVQGWMVNRLKLSGNELLCYALIYGFSQDGQSEFRGSQSYIAESLNVTRENARKILQRLEEKSLIKKRVEDVAGVKFCRYSVDLNVLQSYQGVMKQSTPCNETEHNNIEDNIDRIEDKSSIITVPTTKKERFVKPTLEEVEAYIAEKGYCVNAQQFIDYYTSNGWKVGRNPMKDWKAAVRTWETKERKQYGQNRRFDTDTRTREERRAEFIQGIAAHLAAGNSGPVQDGRGDTLPF